MAVNAAVAHESHEVQGAAVCLAVFHSALEGFVVKEIAVLNGLGDAGKLLIDDATRAHIGVTDLAVSHLSVGKSYCHAGRADGGVGVFRKEFVKIWLACGYNGVAVSVLDAVAVHDAKNKGFFHMFFCVPFVEIIPYRQ